jgi:hypothetical protein
MKEQLFVRGAYRNIMFLKQLCTEIEGVAGNLFAWKLLTLKLPLRMPRKSKKRLIMEHSEMESQLI